VGPADKRYRSIAARPAGRQAAADAPQQRAAAGRQSIPIRAKKVSILFDSILVTESIFSIRLDSPI